METRNKGISKKNSDNSSPKAKQTEHSAERDQGPLCDKLKTISDQAECNYTEITTLRSENAQLKRELDLLRSVVIRMDRKLSHIDDDITDLRSRSMKDNILIHNYPYTQQEDLATSIPNVIKQSLGVDVEFVRIHRNGVRPQFNDKPVTITAKLKDRNKKDEILNAQRLKKIAKQRLPFFITPQQPAPLTSARNKLFDKADSFRKQNINVKVQRNEITMPNGTKYEEEVPLISSADALQISSEEYQSLDDVVVVSTEPVQKDGSEFMAVGANIQSSDEALNIYKKTSIDPYAASCDSRILVYRFRDQSGKTIENYHDDREHGAGRRMLRYLQDNRINDVAIVLTRWMGRSHIGPARFSIMENLVCDLVNKLDDPSDAGK